jgi:thiol-disulfide isomerase/thioredoxin
LLCLLSLFPSQEVRAQSWQERFQWGLKHQRFLAGYVKDHTANSPLSPATLDAHFQEVKNAWANEVGNEARATPYKSKVSPYLYYWMLRKNAQQPLSSQVRCHLLTEYMVPAFLNDFSRLRRSLTPGNLYPISAGLDFVINTGVFGCEIEPRRWENLHSSLESLPGLITSLLKEPSEIGEEFDSKQREQLRTRLRKKAEKLRELRPLLDAKTALSESRLNDAFASLAAAATDGEHTAYRIALSNQLRQDYSAEGKTARAMATLDFLTRSTTAGDLPRDSLRAWYKQVDPERGPERYRQVSNASSRRALVPSEKEANLSGRYTNLTTGEPFDLSRLEGKTVLFDFWATWCAPCIEDIPKLKKIKTEYGDDFALVSISSDALTGGKKTEGVRKFMEKHGIDYTALYDDPDNSLTERFGVEDWPSAFLVDESGTFLRHPTDESHSSVRLEDVEAYLQAQE